MRLSQRKYAEHRKERGASGGSLAAVQKALATGRIEIGADGLIDPEEADRGWLERTNSSQSRQVREKRQGTKESAEEPRHSSAGSSEGQSYFEAQRQREWIRVQKDQLELDLRRQQVVELAPINAWGAGMILKAREELLRIAPELRDRLAQEADPIACEQLVAARIQSALNVLAEYRHKA
jgi:hypothetical protein